MPRVQYVLRNAQPEDQDAIDGLLGVLAASPSDWTGWPPAHIRAATDTQQILAMQGSRVIGLGIAWRNALHPRRRRINLGVHPGHRRRGVARALWDRLAEGRPRHWQTNVESRNVPGRTMLEQLGFELIMRTHLGRLRPCTIPPHRPALPERWSLVRLADAPVAMRDKNVLAELHRDIYTDQHAWDPVDQAILNEEAIELFVGPHDDWIDADNTVIACRAGTPMGVGSLRGDAGAGAVDLGWVGVVGETRAETRSVSIALTDWCLVRVAALSVEVLLEIDDANAPVLEALGAWRVVWSEECVTYALEPQVS